jgi:outer membrane receptor protein involved in Fe transport
LLFLPHQKYIKSNVTDVFDAMRALDFYYDSNNLEFDNKHNLAFDMDFVHKFSKGELSVNAHFTDYNFKQDQNVASSYYDSDDTFLETTEFNTYSNQDTNIYAAKLDYSLPINEITTFETGLKSSHIETNSATARYNIVNGQEILDSNNTDDFDYEENIQAVYLNYSKDFEKWNIILGLRAEQTNIKSKSILNNQTNNQDYLEWFPTSSLAYKPTKNFNLYANYKRSITRPNYQSLNPFKYYNNDNNAFVGNPKLNPSIFDHYIFGTSISEHFTFEAYYQNIKNHIRELPIQDYSTKILFYAPVNIDKSVEYGFDFSANFNVAKDWSVYFLTSFYNIEEESFSENTIVNQNQWSNYSVLQNDFTFLENRSLNINLSVYYAGKNLQGFRIVEDRWVSSLSISKSIIAKKAVISLTAEDLFNAQDYNDSTRYLNQSSSIYTNLDNRFIKLGFRYNFGNSQLKNNSQNKSTEERERLKEKI